MNSNGMVPRNINTVILSCMDGRLNEVVDRYNTDNAIVLRNAGANVGTPSMERTLNEILKQYDINKIILMPHLDCGAMGLVASTLLEGKSADPHVYSDLIQQFKGKFNNRNDLEIHVNPKVQIEKLKEIIGDRAITVTGITLDPKTLNVPAEFKEHEHTLFVTKPSPSHYRYTFEDATEATGIGVGIWGTYVVQPADKSSVRIAIENLGIKRAIFFAENQKDLGDMKRAAREFESESYAKGVRTFVALPEHLKKKMRSF